MTGTPWADPSWWEYKGPFWACHVPGDIGLWVYRVMYDEGEWHAFINSETRPNPFPLRPEVAEAISRGHRYLMIPFPDPLEKALRRELHLAASRVWEHLTLFEGNHKR